MKKTVKFLCLIVISVGVCQNAIFAQRATKPSPSMSGREGLKNKPDSSKRSLPKIASQANFDSIARVYNAKTPYALPHAMFIIDRRDKNKIYYVNSQLYRFHQDFANAQYLSLKRGEEFFKDVYINDQRRFIVGTIAYQIPVKKFTYEFWEGDLIRADLIKLSGEVINKTFFTQVSYKPNSIQQEDYAATLDIPKVSQSEISANQSYLAMNVAKGVGRIHIIDKLDETVEIGYNEIVVLKEIPLDLPPVAGIIMATESTPLSHINLLAKGWNIPNAYIKDADKIFKDYDTHWFTLETKLNDYTITPCNTKECIDDRGKVSPTVYGNDNFKAPPSNLTVTRLAPLGEMRKKDSVIYGSKSANLGELKHFDAAGYSVPDGFGIPFIFYKKFMEANGFFDDLAALQDENEFVHNPSVRRKKLEEFRAKIKNGRFDDELKNAVINQWKTQLGGAPVYVRSSSNAEDMGKFSGAGLYSSVENVTDENKLIEAVKTVWASIWNFPAYEARERNFVTHEETYMAVTVQKGVKMDNGGVMITKDPFDTRNKGAVYISATFGHNIAVTNQGVGDAKKKAVPEQILFTPRSNSVQVLTRAEQETIFVPDEKGGLVEIPFSPKRRILSDKLARQLVKTALDIKKGFGGTEQDIEWGINDGKIYIVQARPYVEKK